MKILFGIIVAAIVLALLLAKGATETSNLVTSIGDKAIENIK